MTERPRAYIAPRRVQVAFGDESASVEPMIVIDHDNGRAALRTVAGEDRFATIVDAEAFAAALQRADLTKVKEHPFLFVNPKRQLIALAFGPPQPPDKIRKLPTVARLEAGSAVEIPAADSTQPSWLLFEAEIAAAPTPTGRPVSLT